MSFEKQMERFRKSLMRSQYAGRTVENYLSQVRKFHAFVREYYPDHAEDPKCITKEIILDYQNYLVSYRDKIGKYLSNQTMRLKLIALRKFFRFLLESNCILSDPSSSIKLPREEKRLIRDIPTQDEVRAMIQSVSPTSPVGLRNRAIIEIFYACGIRTSELCALKLNDVDLKQQTVTVLHGKGGKSRILPIGQYATEYTQRYLEHARKHFLKGKKVDPGNMFLTSRGNPFSKDTINKSVIRHIEKKMKLNKHITAYSFRHAVATHLLQNGVDITYISELLGHASVKTTQIYTKVEISDLQRMHGLYHPRERE